MSGSPYVPLAVADRSGRDESLHCGALVLLDSNGDVIFALGDPNVEIYPRSSVKPLQAWAMLEAGLELDDDLLALACASHDGRAMHVAGVRRILSSVGLDESNLGNTPDLPLAPDEAERVLLSGGGRSPIQQNCSGKHAAMLATCRRVGWPVESYLDSAHPLQLAIAEGIARLSGRPVAHIGTDGCGAPTHVLRLADLARAFGSIASGAAGSNGVRVFSAMTTFPDMVGGPGHPTTAMMRGVAGLVLKDGAEGVFAGALSDGRSLALKIADGSNRARPPVMRAAFGILGIDVSAVDSRAFESVVLGHGRPVGGVRCLGDLAAYAGSQ